jgi:osmoprotectant transport system ATP-binding protein
MSVNMTVANIRSWASGRRRTPVVCGTCITFRNARRSRERRVRGAWTVLSLPQRVPKMRAMASPMISLQHVVKRFDGSGAIAVDDLSFDVNEGETVVLVGPSGCGKTTTMKMVNRLIEPTSGRILVAGRDVVQQDAVELRRGIGYVIQSIGLLPHRTIVQNITTVPQLIGWDASLIRKRVDELVAMLELDPDLLERYPSELSGGQRQRVGVARALAVDPPVMLMDEPFGAVDPIVRERLQDQFIEVQRRLHKTIIFVTHDIDEALKMADRVAIMQKGGILEQYAAPHELLSEPANDFVREFVGLDRGLKRLALKDDADVGEYLDALRPAHSVPERS